MFCPNCGVRNPDEAKFCFGCGKPLPAQGGCSYSFVNWEMLSVRPNRGMLTPSH